MKDNSENQALEKTQRNRALFLKYPVEIIFTYKILIFKWPYYMYLLFGNLINLRTSVKVRVQKAEIQNNEFFFFFNNEI